MHLQQSISRNLVPAMISLIVMSAVVHAQTLQVSAEKGKYSGTYVKANGFEYRISEPTRYDEFGTEDFFTTVQKMASTAGACGAVGGKTVHATSGNDSLDFRFSSDATRIEDVKVVLNNLCGFSFMEVGSSESVPIDPQTCTAEWNVSLCASFPSIPEHRVSFDLNARAFRVVAKCSRILNLHEA